jgi:hypothetical protein
MVVWILFIKAKGGFGPTLETAAIVSRGAGMRIAVLDLG